MKILHVIPTYVPAWRHGGPVVAVHGLAKALARRGHEVTVYTTDVHGDGRLDVPLATPVPLDGVTVWYFPVGFPRRLYRSPALGAHLAKTVAGFDVVHLHSVFLWPTLAAARAARRAGVPYLLAPRGMLVPELLARRGNLRKRLWIALCERKTLAQAAGLHVLTDLEAQDARRLGLPLPPIYCVPNGIDPTPPFDPRNVSPGVAAVLARRPLLLHLGRLNWKKGLDRLVAALADIPGATLALAGNDEEGYQPTLARLAAAAGVAERVVFTGPVHGADKAALLAGADAFVLPSHSENFANAVVEALAAGLPVVLTPEVGLASLVERTGCGVVTTGEPQALAAALRRLLAAPEERAAMGRRGVATAAAEFDWEVVARRMEGVYGEIGATVARLAEPAESAATRSWEG